MKKTLSLLALALLATPFASRAQQGLHFGVKAGLNISNVTSDLSGYKSKSKIGAHLGPMINFGFGRNGNFSVAGELLFDMKGSKQTIEDENGDLKDVPFSLTYIDIPIMVRYRFNFGLYAETGLYFGFLMGASIDGENEQEVFVDFDDNGDPVYEKQKVKDNLKGSDLGYVWGLGYIAEGGWGVGYRWNLGLQNIDDTPSSSSFDSFLFLNVCHQFSFMYYLNWDN